MVYAYDVSKIAKKILWCISFSEDENYQIKCLMLFFPPNRLEIKYKLIVAAEDIICFST